eukprot:1148077-Pelagomonas_calceolata.AAC.2
MGSCPEKTSSRRHELWDSISRGPESVLGAVRNRGALHAGLVTQELLLGIWQYPWGATICLLSKFSDKVLSLDGYRDLMCWNCPMQLPCTLVLVNTCVKLNATSI